MCSAVSQALINPTGGQCIYGGCKFGAGLQMLAFLAISHPYMKRVLLTNRQEGNGGRFVWSIHPVKNNHFFVKKNTGVLLPNTWVDII